MNNREPKDIPDADGSYPQIYGLCGTIQEIDDADLDPLPCVVDLEEFKHKKEYEDFWADSCWREIIQ